MSAPGAHLTLGRFYAIIPTIKPLLREWFFLALFMIKTALYWLIKPHYGSNRLSRFIRGEIEHRSIQELIGVPLMGLTFFGAVIVPQSLAGFTTAEVYLDTQTTTVNAVVVPSRFRWPLAAFGISQLFRGGHQGLDLTNPAGTPIYPITEGKVILVAALYDGYGKHVIVEHKDAMSSIYAHLSRVEVEIGQTVTKDTELGTVGATGWATGNHLHLEILQNGITLNPMEVLPEIKKYQFKDISQIEASTPFPYLSL